MATAKNVSVVLVHGGFVDGSGWEEVHRILREERDVRHLLVIDLTTGARLGIVELRTTP